MEQLERTVRAIEAAKVQLNAQLEAALTPQRAVPVEIVTIDRHEVTEIGLSEVGDDSAGQPYIEAEPARPGAYELHETPLGVMADLVAQVVRIESPVHVDEVVTRLRAAWGLQRSGARIEAAVLQGIQRAHATGRIEREGAFLSSPTVPATLRDRTDTRSSGLRKPELIPPAEIAAGIARIVSANFGATAEEVVTTISRQLGFKATSAPLRRSIESVIDSLLLSGDLSREHNMIVVNPRNEVAQEGPGSSVAAAAS